MPLHIVQNDITQMNVDAIVNAADPLLPGDCPTGSARLTAAYGLPCKYVIHTVTPRWQDGCQAPCFRDGRRKGISWVSQPFTCLLFLIVT